MTTIAQVLCPIFVPADRPERIEKAAASGADAVIVDLEDAVAPAHKDAARARLGDYAGVLAARVPVWLRINAAATEWHRADLDFARDHDFQAIMVPKAEDAAGLSAINAHTGKPLVALVETARGLHHAAAIAEAKGLVRMAFGSVDFCADLGCAHERSVLQPFRQQLVMAARLGNLAAPLDGVTLSVSEPGPVEEDARHARALGMAGKLCIHPAQVGPILAGFAPDEAELRWAEQVLAAPAGVSMVAGNMVDAPVRLRAEAILQRANALPAKS